ncbi:MAG: hypothetical protein PF694_09345 [Bacteroidetes bacterium]|jgi:hypothetical protein|nr:hypothetical protein [Bacteroidota bacterium]
MRNIILFSVLLLLVSSCITKKDLAEMFPNSVVVSDSITTITKTIYRDTTIFVYLPGDTIVKREIVYVNNGIANSRESKLRTDFAWSTAQVINGVLVHDLVQIDSLLKIEIDSAIQLHSTLTDKNRIEKIFIETNKLTGWQWFQIWLGRIFMIILVLFIGYFYVRYIARFP